MNGPEHYREAESDIKGASSFPDGSEAQQTFLARAQVHATLALTAATALAGPNVHAEWDEVAR